MAQHIVFVWKRNAGLVIGALFAANGWRVTIHGNTRVTDIQGDFRDERIVASILKEIQPDVVVNLIALADVDACHRRPSLA